MAIKRFSKCPRCGSELRATPSFAGPPCEFWRECVSCNTFVNEYMPQPHQLAVHKDPHLYIGNFGAYGTGKTTTSREEIIKHMLITPNGHILIGAKVTSQYEQTIRRELESDIPVAFVKDWSTRYAYIDLINGCRISYKPLEDPDTLRSYNITMFVIVEASEVKAEAFHQCKTRNRNQAAMIFEKDADGNILYNADHTPRVLADWRRGIIESNPDSGWIRSDVLLVSEEIAQHGSVHESYPQIPAELDPAISTHVASTDVNKYLPPSFIDEISRNKPAWWVARYVYSSFSYSEGLVYPMALTPGNVVPAFDPPAHWPRMHAHDYGLSDIAAFTWVAIDQVNGIAYVYREAGTNNKNIEELAKVFHDNSKDIPIGGWYRMPLIDPKSGPKRDYNKQTLIDLYSEQGILYEPGQVNLDARVIRLNTYFETGRIKIMDCCPALIEELRSYKFPSKTLNDTKRNMDKPIDKNNHYINTVEWMAMELPADPKNLQHNSYHRDGRPHGLEKERERYMPHALEDDDDYNDFSEFNMMDRVY